MCLVTQFCPTLCHPMDCSPTGSSVHRDSPGKNTGVGCHALLQGIFPTLGLNLSLPHCRRIIYVWASREVHLYLKLYPIASVFLKKTNIDSVQSEWLMRNKILRVHFQISSGCSVSYKVKEIVKYQENKEKWSFPYDKYGRQTLKSPAISWYSQVYVILLNLCLVCT